LKFLDLQIIRFTIIGFISNVINFAIYNLLYYLDISIFLSSLSGFTIGMFFSYYYAKSWVFRAHADRDNNGKKKKHIMLRYIFIYMISGFGMAFITKYLAEELYFNYLVAWFFGAIFAFTNNFFGSKAIFKKS
tara:strand:- start:1036 stop:1434 length:399 start_codon:yes stop_codon:yes gene_type:complete